MIKQTPVRKAAAALSLLLIIALACGPTATPQQGGGEPQTPQPTRQATTPPEDTAISTATPTPVAGMPEPPKTAGQPTPTTDPTLRELLGPKPTPQPESQTSPAHPEGITGCRTLNVHSATYDEIRTLSWCAEELVADVIEACSDISGSTAEQELNCAKNKLADVESYILREYMVPCMAISTNQEREQCRQNAGTAFANHTRKFEAAWISILNAVHDDEQVKLRRAATDQCVTTAGQTPLDDEPFPWQQTDEKRIEKPAKMTAAQQQALETRYRRIDQCATEQGLYAAQEEAWITELQERFRDDPNSVQPLFDESIKTILEEDGIALFIRLDPPSGR